MAKGNLLTCRVCGKQYKGCKSCEANQGVFHWRNFASSDIKKKINNVETATTSDTKKAVKKDEVSNDETSKNTEI